MAQKEVVDITGKDKTKYQFIISVPNQAGLTTTENRKRCKEDLCVKNKDCVAIDFLPGERIPCSLYKLKSNPPPTPEEEIDTEKDILDITDTRIKKSNYALIKSIPKITTFTDSQNKIKCKNECAKSSQCVAINLNNDCSLYDLSNGILDLKEDLNLKITYYEALSNKPNAFTLDEDLNTRTLKCRQVCVDTNSCNGFETGKPGNLTTCFLYKKKSRPDITPEPPSPPDDGGSGEGGGITPEPSVTLPESNVFTVPNGEYWLFPQDYITDNEKYSKTQPAVNADDLNLNITNLSDSLISGSRIDGSSFYSFGSKIENTYILDVCTAVCKNSKDCITFELKKSNRDIPCRFLKRIGQTIDVPVTPPSEGIQSYIWDKNTDRYTENKVYTGITESDVLKNIPIELNLTLFNKDIQKEICSNVCSSYTISDSRYCTGYSTKDNICRIYRNLSKYSVLFPVQFIKIQGKNYGYLKKADTEDKYYYLKETNGINDIPVYSLEVKQITDLNKPNNNLDALFYLTFDGNLYNIGKKKYISAPEVDKDKNVIFKFSDTPFEFSLTEIEDGLLLNIKQQLKEMRLYMSQNQTLQFLCGILET